MMALGFFSIAVLMAAITLQLASGIRLDGWLGIAFGAMGVAYCYVATASWGLIPVFVASSVVMLYGVVGAAVKLWRQCR